MNEDISQKLENLEQKVDAIYASTEKTRKYFMWTLIISVLLFVIPLIGIFFAIPSFLGTYTGEIQGLTQ